MSVCLSVRPSVCRPACLPVCPCVSGCSSVCRSVGLLCQSVCQPVRLSVLPSVSVYPSILLSRRPCLHRSNVHLQDAISKIGSLGSCAVAGCNPTWLSLWCGWSCGRSDFWTHSAFSGSLEKFCSRVIKPLSSLENCSYERSVLPACKLWGICLSCASSLTLAVLVSSCPQNHVYQQWDLCQTHLS